MSKGDKRRPTAVDNEAFEERWARTFGGTPEDDHEVIADRGVDPGLNSIADAAAWAEADDERSGRC